MDPQEVQLWREFIQLMATMATLGAASFAGWLAYKAKLIGEHNAEIGQKNAEIGKKNAESIAVIKKATDGLTDKLVNETRISSHAAGVKEEKERNGA